MGLLNKNYVIEDGPKELCWYEYYKLVMDEYNALLIEKCDDEKAFQMFFENNPSMLPGGLELFGQSGHHPHMNTIITQPSIGITYERKPDFLWLAQDSLTFCPVFIEIEKPSKRMFTDKGQPNAEFNQAMNQIDEWRMILNKPLNQLAFMDYYDIPQATRDKVFEPQFLLVYGRREEYERSEYLRNLRKQKERENVALMSYDRLTPLMDYQQFITCKVKNKKYEVVSIPPTFRYVAGQAEELYKWTGFLDKIDDMKYTTDERKNFLKSRFGYWTSVKCTPPGIIVGMEGE